MVTHPDAIWALSWTSADRLISGCADGHIRVYDPSDLTVPLQDIHANPLAISSLATSSDGRYALSGSLDGTVALLDLESGEEVGKSDTGREKIGDTTLPAFACAVHPSLSCWAWSGRSSKLGFRTIPKDSISKIITEDINGQGESSFNPLSGEARVIDTGKGKFGMDVKFSPDGQSLALATESGQIMIVDVETGEVLATYTSHAMAVRTISWSEDSQWLFSGSDDHRIVIHDVRAGSKSGQTRGEGAVAILQGHQSWVLRVSAGPDGKLLGSGGADNMVKLWDIGQRSCVSTIQTSSEVWGLDWQPASVGGSGVGKQFAIAGEDKMVTIYRAAGSS
ncbi:hypothetical protein M231_06072 [Tremella mesenterica]|uniref:Anaphase-promoting complex subunit 4 WD40 domain-containing protein n=1 Tax=Tremella mesenterica TaxID=5217 RepID=A0A4Q1BGJ5_TREME|nr:hypothetical protein M231_06072 [Tremella mesenterica]